MFDARSILDILLGGGPRPRQGQPMDRTVFKDMLDQLGNQDSPPVAGRQVRPGQEPQQAPGGRWTEQRPQAPQETTGQPGQLAPTGGMSLEELLRGILSGAGQQGPAGGAQPTPSGQTSGGQARPNISPEVSNELQDLLRQILQAGGGGATKIPVNRLMDEGGAAQNTESGRQLAATLKQVLGQATAGAREGAARIGEATGLSARAREAVGDLTGQTPEELVAQLKELIANNQLAAGAALGGLGALVLGTSAGRSLAATAIKLGSLALIGGLAYKAYQNYQQGRPIVFPGQPGEKQTLVPAPEGSGFEAGAVTHDAAKLYIRAMIAAAAADGRIDAVEQQKILGGLRQAGIEDAAQEFLAAEISSPATVAELGSGISSPEEAVQVYTAARIAVDPDSHEEHAFLSSLAQALGIDDELAAQVEAATRGAA
ncbi:MAG TPA: DUF533 domain-containing protein [Hyphomicrobiaceae bacterium]|jgi:uncharacterized membrane protein YebE (DUF533 family)|nr:DUF533 domain-containing protein [Hyphomicrobiaceae bacterium]